MTRAQSSHQGFALVVIAALFLAFALVAGAMIERTNATQELNKFDSTRAQLARISSALTKFSVFNLNRYPCPASTAVAVGDAAFGTSLAGCQNGTATGMTVLSGNTAVRGMVPVAALAPYGIDPNDAFDAWNNRIMYVVDRHLTVGSAGVASATGRPTVTEQNTSVTFKQPDFVVISYGRDGLGGIPRSQTSVAIACPGDSSLRSKNCDDDTNFVSAPPILAASTTAAQYFDDILSFSTSAVASGCPTQTLTWGGNCSAVFTATPKGATTMPVANTASGYSGAARATCSGTVWGTPTGSCTVAACVPTDDIYITSGIQPGVCPIAAYDSTSGMMLNTVYQASHYDTTNGCWPWNNYAYTTTPTDPSDPCVVTAQCTATKPTPYVNSCGVINGPTPH